MELSVYSKSSGEMGSRILELEEELANSKKEKDRVSEQVKILFGELEIKEKKIDFFKDKLLEEKMNFEQEKKRILEEARELD